MPGYTKLFSSILESTIWCESSDTRVVWITMLASADRDGIVWGTIPGLAKRAAVDVDKVRQAVGKFLGPDPDSSDPEFEGRRIQRVTGGWRLLNHEKYRHLQDEDDVREKTAARVRRYRERQAATERNVALPNVTVTESNACNDIASPSPSPSPSPKEKTLVPAEREFEELWEIWPRHEKRSVCKSKFKVLHKHDDGLILERAKKQVTIWEQEGKEKQFIPMLHTWLNQKRYDTEPEFIGGKRTDHGKRDVSEVIAEALDELEN